MDIGGVDGLSIHGDRRRGEESREGKGGKGGRGGDERESGCDVQIKMCKVETSHISLSLAEDLAIAPLISTQTNAIRCISEFLTISLVHHCSEGWIYKFT